MSYKEIRSKVDNSVSHSVISECVDHALDRVSGAEVVKDTCDCFIYSQDKGCRWGTECPLYGSNECEKSSLVNNILKKGV